MTESLTKTFAHKIKTAEELAEILPPLPRDQKVIMCHGVFDVVHPGHMRHMLYAKSKADILVASLTADRHIDKGKYRPHVPEDLRAANLAAFEFVDYVVIDRNAKPLRNLGVIKPDFFAKGYEYQDGGIHPKTAEEIDQLAQHGGQVIFTPGDVVYSSSNLIELEPPSIKYEKLQLLMEREGFSFEDLRDTVRKMPGHRVHVVGDTIIDTLTECAMIGGQTKTPTMSVLYQGKKEFVGGAGIVAKHMKAAGAEVVFSTVLGKDHLADFTIEDVKAAGVDIRAIIDPLRPTTNKNAIVVGGYRLLKVDTLDNTPISKEILDQLVDAVSNVPTDAVVFSDFRHGLFSKGTIPALTAARPEGAYSVADSQVASRWGNITEFKRFNMITPNEREARFATGEQDAGVRALSSMVYDRSECDLLILKLGDRGVLTCRSPNHESSDSFFTIDSFVNTLVDAVGSGDALMAYATLAMLVSGSEAQATVIGSLAAACECECNGNIPIGTSDVLARIDAVEAKMGFN